MFIYTCSMPLLLHMIIPLTLVMALATFIGIDLMGSLPDDYNYKGDDTDD